MSAPCLRLPAAGSAPAEADSAGGMEPPAAAGAAAAAALELALEEELALLAAAGEPPELPPAAAARDPELLSLIRQKEKDLVLAARLGKALLERNQDMSRQYERMHKELTDKLEVRPRRFPPSFPWTGAVLKGPWSGAAAPGSPADTPRGKRPILRQIPGTAAGTGPAEQPTELPLAVTGKKGSKKSLLGLGEAKLLRFPFPGCKARYWPEDRRQHIACRGSCGSRFAPGFRYHLGEQMCAVLGSSRHGNASKVTFLQRLPRYRAYVALMLKLLQLRH